MYKHLLVPTDGSELSKAAVAEAVKFAKALSADITAVFCKPEFPVFYFGEGAIVDPITNEQFEAMTHQQAHEYLQWVQDQAAAAGVSCTVVEEINDHPHQAIIAAAEKAKCDLIFMASHGRKGFSALLLGSETQKVLTHSKIPVLVYR